MACDQSSQDKVQLRSILSIMITTGWHVHIVYVKIFPSARSLRDLVTVQHHAQFLNLFRYALSPPARLRVVTAVTCQSGWPCGQWRTPCWKRTRRVWSGFEKKWSWELRLLSHSPPWFGNRSSGERMKKRRRKHRLFDGVFSIYYLRAAPAD